MGLEFLFILVPHISAAVDNRKEKLVSDFKLCGQKPVESNFLVFCNEGVQVAVTVDDNLLLMPALILLSSISTMNSAC